MRARRCARRRGALAPARAADASGTTPGQALPEDFLPQLLDLHAIVSTWLAKCHFMTQDGLSRLAFECLERIPSILASRQDADASLLDRLAADGLVSVRLRVACNAASSRATLARLATDADFLVRAVAAEKLAEHPDNAADRRPGSGSRDRI